MVLAVAVLVLVWLVAVVGLIGASGEPADRLYLVVPVTAMVGSSLGRVQPRGMAVTSAVMAAEMVGIGAVAILAGLPPAAASSWRLLGLSLGFALCFAAAGLAFRRADDAGGPVPAPPGG